MALFTLADLHLSLSVDKPMDVFGGVWTRYEEKLKEYWEYMVRPEDTVVVPGDISWGMTTDEALADLRFIHALPGRKILMKGNHDYWWQTMAKLERFREENGLDSLSFLHNDAVFCAGKILCGSRGWCLEEGMPQSDEKVLLREAIRFGISLDKAALLQKEIREKTGVTPEIICFSHYPVLTPYMTESPIFDVIKKYPVRRVYYGHLHNWSDKPLVHEKDGVSFTLVSSDYRSFTPVRID